MLPKYEVYVSLLTGMWMPWLENNRLSDRFEHLLQPSNTANGNACSNFFRMLVRQSGASHSPAAQLFMQEALHLADGENYDAENPFFSLPASTTRQQFYNRLTGYCFNGYDQWAKRILTGSQGRETTDWYRMRMTGTLLELVKSPVPLHQAEHPERVIACRVLAALCILLHRLRESGSSSPGAGYRVCSIRDDLQSGLAAFTLEAPARLEIMELFDALTGEKKVPVAAPVVHLAARPALQQAAAALAASEPDLTAMVKAMKTDVDAMLKAVGRLILVGPLQGKPTAGGPEQYLDSVTVMSRLSIGSTTLQRYREKGMLPYTKIGGKYCYLVKDVQNFIEEGKNKKKYTSGNHRPPQPEH